MTSEKSDLLNDLQVTRRLLINSGAALAAVPLAACADPASTQENTVAGPAAKLLEPPFDSIRDYVTALEQRGLLQRFDGINQDNYEGTAIMYRLIDEFGLREAPAVMFTNRTANGRTYPGPVVANLQGNLLSEPLLLGGEVDPENLKATYQNVTRRTLAMLEERQGVWAEIEPHEIPAEEAVIKQVRLEGDEIDVLAFPFLRGNPGDAGPYINTASVFTRDPDLGVNFGTYRCQIKGPRKIMINFEGGQTGIKMVDAARKRGETSMPITLVIGQDPLTWVVSSSRIPSRIRNRGPIDELSVAGGLRGKAVDVVRTESGHFLVPANAEIVIEGTVDIVNLEEEGPYHEMYGYLGHKKEENYVMTAQTVTHRKDPWVMNSFTGVVREYITSLQRAENIYNLRKSFPQVVDYESPHDSQGLVYISIKKDAPGQGLEVARPTAMFNPLARVVIVVDDDVDVLDSSAVRFAIGSRWQPALASEIIENRRAFPLDPASPDRKTTSKIIIDATRQWPEEGGPKIYQRLNRTVFEEAAPDAIAKVLAKWPDKLNK
ncbi:MAG: UbiD family decarboxylase [Gammaproteobacteria bacterium]|nr:UbiD family decarboxylase [Gammaproteobacteria bacterium]